MNVGSFDRKKTTAATTAAAAQKPKTTNKKRRSIKKKWTHTHTHAKDELKREYPRTTTMTTATKSFKSSSSSKIYKQGPRVVVVVDNEQRYNAMPCYTVNSEHTFNMTRYDDDDDEEEGNGCFAHTKNRFFCSCCCCCCRLFVRSLFSSYIAAYSRIFVDLVESCFVLCCARSYIRSSCVCVVCTHCVLFLLNLNMSCRFCAWNGMDFERTNETKMNGCTG